MYDDLILTPISPLDPAWAVGFVRALLRDVEEPYAYEDPEIFATLRVTAYRHRATDADGNPTLTLYFRPHMGAAAMLRSDPQRALRETVDNTTTWLQDPEVAAANMLRDYAMIDDMIADLTGQEDTASTFEAVF